MGALSAFLLAALATLAVYAFKQLWLHGLARIPGPRLAALTDAWSGVRTIPGKLPDAIAALHAKHGDIVRIGPDEVSVVGLEAQRQVYGAGWHKYKPFYVGFNDPGAAMADIHNLFSESDPALHAEKKRYASKAYSVDSLGQFRHYIEEIVADHADGLARQFKAGDGVVDMGDAMSRLACDVACQLALGPGVDVQKTKSVGIVEALEQSIVAMSLMGRWPALQPLWFNRPVQWLSAPTPVGRNFAALKKTIYAQIQAHLAQPDARHDMLTLFLEGAAKRAEATGQPLDLDYVWLSANAVCVAGTDTSGYTMAAFLHHVCADRALYDRLTAECDELAGSEAEGPLLRACLYETFRLSPGVTYPMPRIVPAGGAVVNGTHLPAGTRVSCSAELQHRLAHFGADLDRFVPERWLVADPADAERQRAVSRMEQQLFVFGAGAHMCIGRHISLLEMRIALPELLRRFDLRLVDPKAPLESYKMWFSYARNVKIRATLRVR